MSEWLKGATPSVFLYVTHCSSSSRQVIQLVAEMEVFRTAFVDTYSFLSDAGDVTNMVVALYADSDDNDNATSARRRSIRRRRGRLLQLRGEPSAEPSAQPSAEPTMTFGQEEDLSQLENIIDDDNIDDDTQLENILDGEFSKIVRNLNNRNLQTVGNDSYSHEFSFSHSYSYSYSEPNYDDKNDTAAADDAGYAYFGNDDAATTTVELSYTFSFVVSGEVSRRRLRESLELQVEMACHIRIECLHNYE